MTYYWPARIERDAGRVRVEFLSLDGCAAYGATLEEAVAGAKAKAQQRIAARLKSGDIILPPVKDLVLDDLVDGHVTRIEICLDAVDAGNGLDAAA